LELKNNSEKIALRKVFLEKRDSTSFDMTKIASKKIAEKLKKIDVFKNADSIACYYSIGSEVSTQEIIQELLSNGKQVSLPRVVDDELYFHQITDIKNLEIGSFGIMEPKENTPVTKKIDVILVPTVAVSRDGTRLGYGHGYYDRFLANTKANTISLTYSKQILKSIPSSNEDVKMQWVVTEDEFFKTSTMK